LVAIGQDPAVGAGGSYDEVGGTAGRLGWGGSVVWLGVSGSLLPVLLDFLHGGDLLGLSHGGFFLEE
jgi:hypothetical protein